ncbi:MULTISPECIES: WcbI family polysaccharide biosynthesis putative acetyltransferase [Citrobacter]|jgi:hypothetical protein|uniref:WcbI family polysaccharide biosynthesis putative acetyltransferase n=1 Tax=Citrobacter TaxID=544 RepID=UPI001B340C88|nr:MULTISPECIES: WcbI family polysaccharide biosynthesis putative acetyltransferase [Citrobacter]MBP5851356.1 hypothetical protein [Citrobacter sp. AN-PRR1]MBY5200369.1 hypothetical protein [Citrobacter braakii]
MKKVGIYLTCQGYLVKKAIELVYPDFKVFFMENWRLIESKKPLSKEYDDVDIFIYQELVGDYPDFLMPNHIITNRLKPDVQLVSVPYIVWTGLFPWAAGGEVLKPNKTAYCNTWLDRYTESTSDIAFKWDDVSESEIIENAEKSLSILENKELTTDVKGIADYIRNHYKYKPLFYTINHPRGQLALFYVNQIFRCLGWPELPNSMYKELDRILDVEKSPLSERVSNALDLKYSDRICYYSDKKPRTVFNYLSNYFN